MQKILIIYYKNILLFCRKNLFSLPFRSSSQEKLMDIDIRLRKIQLILLRDFFN